MFIFKALFSLVVFLAVATVKLVGQPTVIRGQVKDHKSNPLPGASISIRNSYDGSTADSLGNYSFKTSEKGDQVLVFSSIGYVPVEQPIKIIPGVMTVDVSLKEEISELRAVILSAGTFEASDRKKASAVLDPIDIVTTASANGDITGALKTLPGAQQVGESEGLFVRGGTAAETKTFIDGTPVNNFFYSSVPNIAQFGRFSPFIFKGTVFSTGGYSALYGQALSSALILESVDFPERSSANLGLTVLSMNGGYQHLSRKKDFSAGGSYSYTDLGPVFRVIKQKQDYMQAPAYHNADLNFRIRTSKTGILKYYGYFSSSRLAFTVPSIDSLGYYDRFGVRNTNLYQNLAWKESLGKKWKLQSGISFTYNEDDISSGMRDAGKQEVVLRNLEQKTFEVDLEGSYFNAKMVVERKLKGLSAFRVGGEYNFSRDSIIYSDYNNQTFPALLKEHLKSFFAEADLYATNDLALKAGLRYEHSSYFGKSNLAPRVSFAYKLGRGSQASLAWGIFYQNPEKRNLPSPVALDFMKATHYIAQYQRVINQQSFRAEIFYKKYKGLVKTGNLFGPETAISNGGAGDAKGVELFWRDKKNIKNLDYWVSYSFLDTRRDHLNFPFAITPSFAARHTASLVFKRFVQDWKMNLNAAYNFSSGRPYYHIANNGNEYVFTDRGLIPSYHNVSFAINYLPFIGKKDPKTFAVYVLQVSNILNLKQTYGYQYSYNGLRKEAIVPTSRMFVFIGAFISFGVDRSDEITNSLGKLF